MRFYQEYQKMNCKNCGLEAHDNYCSHCGQRVDVSRITFSGLVQEVSESVFQIDKGLFFTIKELLIRPGKSISEFLDGKRKNHFKPIAFVLTLSTVYFLVAQLSDEGTYLDQFIDGYKNGLTKDGSGLKELELVTWFSKNYAYASLILLPVFSLASYLAFLRAGRNYIEHIVLNAYISGLQALCYSSFTLIGEFIINDFLELVPFVISAGYNFWVFWQFFPSKSRILNLVQTALTYILFLLFNLVFFILLSGLILTS